MEKVSKNFVILSGAKNLSWFCAPEIKEGEILRSAQNDKINYFFPHPLSESVTDSQRRR
jgi:hypothetical protein